MKPTPLVLHFVTGGGSGSTRVALDLALAHQRTGAFRPLLVLRRKRNPLPAPMAAEIAAAALPVAWVDNWPHFRTTHQLVALCAAHRPAVFVAHGNSEHLWGRRAALRTRVPVVVHVEQNREHYSFFRRRAAAALAPRTHATVCVSTGVRDHLHALSLASARIEIIPNGVRVDRFSAGPPLTDRPPDIVMAARFARQKDHATLVRAARRLADTGWNGRLILAGGGSARHARRCAQLVRALGLEGRVDLPGPVPDIASLYQCCRVAVLSTHYEGLPLALVESMAAGCAAIGSAVCGVVDVITPDATGWLFPKGDDDALAALLGRALAATPDIQAVADAGATHARRAFSLEGMVAAYETLFTELLREAGTT